MLRNVLSRAILFALVCAAFASNVKAVPTVLSHQGRLLDASDAPISGTFTIIYSIHDAPVGGVQLWMEDHVGVVVTDGLFSVELGSTVPLTADIVAGSGGGGGGGGGSLRYLQVQLSGQPPIMPRTQLVSTPYSLATERVSGDFQTRPGLIVIGDTALGKSATFGEKVNQGLHAAGSALASGASLLKEECDDNNADYLMKHTHGSFANFLHMHSRVDSVGLSSSYSDATVETGMTHSSTTDGSSFSLSTKDNIPNRISMNVTIPKQSSGRLAIGVDLGDDGAEDNSVSLSSGLTSSRVAIKTKGTGADKNRSISSECDDSSAVHVLDIDDDGDGIAEGRGIISVKSGTGSGSMSASSRMSCDSDDDGVDDNDASMIVTPTTSSVAIKTKGTGADANRTALLSSTTEVGEISTVSSLDEDGDGLSESSISQRIAPTTSSLAIKTKGTSAQRTQTISGDCDDQSSVLSLDTDDDGDGTSDAKVVLGSGASLLGGTLPGGAVISSRYDSNDDGIAENEIDQVVTPTTAGVAIKTKGTGADKNRTISSSCDDSSAVHYLDVDDDGDGIAEGRGIISVKSATGTGSMSNARMILSSDPDENGVDDMSVVSSCDSSHAKIVMDRDSGRSKARMGVTGTESSVAVEDDSDGDGVSEFSSQLSCDGSSARGQLTATAPGTSNVSSVTFEVDATGPAIRLTDGGFAFHLMNGDGSVLRSTSNVVVADMDRDGNLFLASNLSVGAPGGTHHIDVAGGAYCDGTNWVNASDRNSKENFVKVDGEEILEKISGLEITKWNYKGDDDAQHIGPTAQDFKKTFGVGADDKSISTIDPSGIALAAIKELYRQFSEEMKQKDAQIEELQKEMKKLRQELKQKNN